MLQLILGLEFVYILLWIAQSSLLFIPGLILIVLLGAGLRKALFIRAEDKYEVPWFLIFIVNCALGVMGIVCLAVLLSLTYFFNEIILKLSFLGITLGLSLIPVLRSRNLEGKGKSKNNQILRVIPSLSVKWTNILAIMSVVLATSIMVYLRSSAPFPTFGGLDHFHYMTKVFKLFEEGGLTNLFLSGSSSIMGIIEQPLSYYSLIGAFLILLDVHFLSLFFWGPFFVLPLYAILIFTLGLKIFKNEWLAFFAVFMGLTITGQGHFYGAHDIYATSISQMLFIIMWFYFYLIRDKLGVKEFIFMGMLSGLLFLIYPFTLIINIPLVAFYVRDKKKQKYLFSALVIMIILGVIYAQGIFPENWSHSYQVDRRWKLLNISYSWIHMGLGIIGIILLALKSVRAKISSSFLVPALAYSALLIGFYWSGLPQYTIRFEWYWRIFFTLAIAIPFLGITQIKKAQVRKYTMIAVVLFLFICEGMGFSQKGLMSPWLVSRPIYDSHNAQKFMGGAISQEEFSAMKWLEKNTTPSDYIVTDPYMGDILRGTINRQTSSALTLSSGESPSVSSPRYSTLRILNFEFLNFFRAKGDYLNHTIGKSVESNLPENEEYSLNKGNGAENLVDGKNGTSAYPGSKVLDYTVDLGAYLPIDLIKITWGEYGFPSEDGSSYISEWKVSGKTEEGWKDLAFGLIPNKSSYEGEIQRQFVSMLRLYASGENWNGVYEFSGEERVDNLNLAQVKEEMEEELERIELKITPKPKYLLITPRMSYWLQYNQLKKEDGTPNKALGKLANWPIVSTEVNTWDYEKMAEKLKWAISYQTENIFIVEIP